MARFESWASVVSVIELLRVRPGRRRPRRPSLRRRPWPGRRRRPRYDPAEAPGETRTKSLRRRTTSEATRPNSAAIAETRVNSLPGSVRTEKPAKRSTPSNVMEPRPPGRSKVWPGLRRIRSWSVPSAPVTGVISAVSSAYTDCGRPPGRSSPSKAVSASCGSRVSGKIECGPDVLSMTPVGRKKPAKPSPLGLAPGHLHRADRGVVVVLREEDRGLGVQLGALGVAHGDPRRVAVAEEEDGAVAGLERAVDPDGALLGVAVGGGEGRRRLEVARGAELPAALGLGLELDVEPVEREGPRLEVVDVDPRPGAEGVVARQRVRQGLALGHDDVALPAEQVAPADPDEDPDERHVEDEVAGLADVALLRRQGRVVVGVDAVAPTTQGGAQPLADLLGVAVDLRAAVCRKAVEATRRLRRGRRAPGARGSCVRGRTQPMSETKSSR